METLTIMHLGKFSGTYNRKTRTFIKYRKESDIFRKFNGISIPISVLDKVKKLGCLDVEILLRMNNGTTKEYRTALNKWYEEGIIYNKGADFQRILTFNQLEGKKEPLAGANFGNNPVSKIQKKEQEIIRVMKENIARSKGKIFYRANKEEKKKLRAIAYTVPLEAFN